MWILQEMLFSQLLSVIMYSEFVKVLNLSHKQVRSYVYKSNVQKIFNGSILFLHCSHLYKIYIRDYFFLIRASVFFFWSNANALDIDVCIVASSFQILTSTTIQLKLIMQAGDFCFLSFVLPALRSMTIFNVSQYTKNMMLLAKWRWEQEHKTKKKILFKVKHQAQ